jgi:hypothetical protein
MAITWKEELQNVQVNIGEAINSTAEVNGTNLVDNIEATDSKFNDDYFVAVGDTVGSGNDGFFNTPLSTVNYQLMPKQTIPDGNPFILHKKTIINEDYIIANEDYTIMTALHGNPFSVKIKRHAIELHQDDVKLYGFTLFKIGEPAYDGINYTTGDILETFILAREGILKINVILTDNVGNIKESHEFTSPSVYTTEASFKPYVDVRADLLGDNIKTIPLYYNLELSDALIEHYEYELQHDSVVINKIYSLNRIYINSIESATNSDAGTYVLAVTQGIVVNTTTMVITIVALDDMLKEDDRIVFEVGYAHPSSLFVKWCTTNPDDIMVNSIKLDYKETNIFSNEENDNIEHINIPAVSPEIEPVVNTWEISAMTLANEVINKKFFFEWRYLSYYGTSLDAVLDETGVKNLASKELIPSLDYTYNFGTGGYKYFALPKPIGSYTLLMSDASNNWSVPYVVVDDNLAITNEYGVTSLYILIRTFNILNNSISIRIN